jgi:cytochrome P450
MVLFPGKLIQSNTLSIAFWYLTFVLTSEKYFPAVLKRIRSYALPNATIESDAIFNLPALFSDPLLVACFQETLRLRAQNGSVRVVNEETIIPINDREYLLRKGSLVFIPAPLIHLDPEIYDNATDFLPERFLDSDLESTIISNEVESSKPPSKLKFFKNGVPVRHYLLPFGGGDNLVHPLLVSRLTQCTGRRFAQNEVIATAAILLHLYDFTSPGGGPLAPPAPPRGKRFGTAAEGPGETYMIRMRSAMADDRARLVA